MEHCSTADRQTLPWAFPAALQEIPQWFKENKSHLLVWCNSIKPVQPIGFPDNQLRFKFSQILNALKKAPNITKTNWDDCEQIEISLNFLACSVNPLHWFIYFCLSEDGLNVLCVSALWPSPGQPGIFLFLGLLDAWVLFSQTTGTKGKSSFV